MVLHEMNIHVEGVSQICLGHSELEVGNTLVVVDDAGDSDGEVPNQEGQWALQLSQLEEGQFEARLDVALFYFLLVI